MILAVRCDQPSFKDITFQRGFNVIVAERNEESTERGSRNGLGKTTLLEIIHFCLGSSVSSGKGLLQKPLIGWTFSLDIELRGHVYTVRRNTEDPNWVFVDGDFSHWPLKPREDSLTSEPYMAVKDWRDILGWLSFNLSLQQSGDEPASKYRPTFRSLISYFVRKGRDAFSKPFEHHRNQREWDKQVNNAFLIGLNWQHASEWQVIKDREATLNQLAKAAKSGEISSLLGSMGELETSKVRIEGRLNSALEELDSFRVHPQYRRIEEKVDELTSSIHELVNQNIADTRVKEFYRSDLRDGTESTEDLITEVYREAEIELPGLVVKRLDDVKRFNELVASNRMDFLEAEVNRLQDRVNEREAQISAYTEERAQLLDVLRTHGALEEYTRLQQLYSEMVSELEDVKTRIENLRKFEQGKSAVRIEREKLQQEARRDYDERLPIIERAISLFNENSEALYDVPGNLVIDIGQQGFKFQVDIERSMSQGIEQMKVFCYDLMLTKLWSNETTFPKFLVHDSTIFDGVDERQVAHALQLAARDSEVYNFQYICCLNSDVIPNAEFDEDFKLNDFLRLELTDSREDGGLLGIRF